MRRAAYAGIVVFLAGSTLSGCSTGTGPTVPTVQTRARFFNGATPAGGPSVQLGFAPAAALTATVPGNGRWMLSPDRVTMTLTHIRLGGGATGNGGGGSGSDVTCSITYDKSKPGLTQLSDCAFAVPAGTFNTLNLTFSASFDVYVNDAVNGFYSTATGIVTAPPAGGAQQLTVTLNDGTSGLSPIKLPKELVIADSGTAATASIVVNGLQFFRVDVNNGNVTLGWASAGNPTPMRPDLVGTVGVPAAVEYYVAQALGTAGSYCAGACTSPTGITAVAVYYTSATTPAIMGMNLSGTPATCSPIGVSFVNDPRGYQGLDAAGNLGWATASDTSWKTYTAELRMARVSALGGTTTLYCKTRSTDPAPAGGSYASGAPNIAVPANSLGTYILVAR